jgi:anti-anti-sigma factor
MKAEFKISKTKTETSLSVTGDLTVQAGAQFKDQLGQLLQRDSTVELSLKGVSAMDISAVQLILCFKNECELKESKIHIFPPENAGLIALLGQTGLWQVINDKK